MRTTTNQSNLIDRLQSGQRRPFFNVTKQDDLLRFSYLAQGVDSSLPNTLSDINGSPGGYVATYLDGSGHVMKRNFNFVSDPALTGGTNVGGTYNSLRNTVSPAGAVYHARWTDWTGVPTLYADGSIYNGSPGLPNMSNTSTLVRRVDAVCYATDCLFTAVTSIVSGGAATTDFFRVTPSTTEKLTANLQSDQYGTMSPTMMPETSYISAIKIDDYYLIVATECWSKESVITQQTTGKKMTMIGARAVFFTYRNGVCSEVLPAYPISPDFSDHVFYPTGLSKMGSLYYLSGQMRRPFSDGTSVFMEMYLTSKDGKKWSMGEWSSFVSSTDSIMGKMVLGLDSVYYAGKGKSYSAPARVIDGIGSSTAVGGINGITYSFATDSADDLVLSFTTKHPDIKAGDTLAVDAGYRASPDGYARLGLFSVDAISFGRGVGQKTTEIQGPDKGSWILGNWKANTDVDRASQVRNRKGVLDSLSEIILKNTFEENPVASGYLKWDELNTPLIAYTPFRDSRDGIAHASVRFGDHNGNALSTFSFLFGANTDSFNAVTFPRANSWSAFPKTGVEIRKATKIDYNYEAESKNFDAGSETITQLASVTTVWDQPFQAAAGADYMLSFRMSGGRIQAYARALDSSYANADANCESYLLGDWEIGNERMRYADQANFGFAAATDTYSRQAPGHLQYDELSASITLAREIPSFTRIIGTGVIDTDGQHFTSSAPLELYRAIQLTGTNHVLRGYVNQVIDATHYRLILGIANWGPNVFTGISEGCTIRAQDNAADWGYVDSGYSVLTAVDGANETLVQNTGAFRTTDPVYGTIVMINEDGTAMQIAEARSDGIRSYLQTGTVFGLAFSPLTNPIESGAFNAGQNGSKANDWRQIIWPSWLFEDDLSGLGIPDTGYFIVEGEVVRYAKRVIKMRDNETEREICWIPTYIFLSRGAAANTNVIPAWRDVDGNQPGSDVNDIWDGGDGKYYLVTVSGMSGTYGEVTDAAKQLYLDSVVKVVSPSPSNTDQIVLDKNYPMEVRSIDQKDFSLMRVDGRGQLQTIKKTHTDKARLTYYPKNIGTNSPLSDLIRVNRFDPYVGQYVSLQDNLDYICNLAGVREPKFRPIGDYFGNLSSQVNLATLTQDFVLESKNAYIPNGSNKLTIGFRGYYELDISQPAAGAVRLVLRCPTSSIVGSEKRLHRVDIPVSRVDISPSSSTYHGLRVVVQDKLISVYLDGQSLWVFNLDYFPLYVNTNAGTVFAKYTGVTGTGVDFSLQELWGEIEGAMIDMNMTGLEAIASMISDRRIFMRPTSEGGIEFSRFTTRDFLTLPGKIFTKTDSPRSISPAGHINVSGAEYGEHVDEEWMQENGYRFDTGQNRFLNTVADSKVEAKAQVRDAKMQSLRRTLSIAPDFILQQEDEVLLDEIAPFPSGPDEGDPTHYVLESGSISIELGNAAAQYELKKKYDL